MSKKTAILSIFVLMLAFLAFGIINVAMGRPSLLTSKLNMESKETNSNEFKGTSEDKASSEKKDDGKSYLSVKISNEIEQGTSGDEIKKIQYILKDRGYFKGEVNGQFEGTLADSIKTFQKDNGLEPTGKLTVDVIEKITGEKMDIDYSKIVFTKDLYPNMNGLDVRKAQFLLIKAGYYKGNISGVFDAETKKAVVNFQKDKKITQTGNIGKMTQKALDEIK